MSPRVVVVGLGPGDPGLVTDATRRRIDATPRRWLRTTRHPSARLVPDAGSFDDLYDSLPTFDEVYAAIVERLVAEAGEHGEVLYAVPGSPLVLERTVALLRGAEGVEVVVEPAISFLDEVWRALGIDPVEAGVRLVDGHRFAVDAAGVGGPLLVAHTHANWVLSDVKLSVDEPDDDLPVTLLWHLGLPEERIVPATWGTMDRVVEADHLTTLWVPAMTVPVATEMARLHGLAHRLRRECPWDIEQTHASLVRYLLEETYEVVDALDRLDPDDPATDDHLVEELGDLLYQVEFHCAIAEQEGRFTLADVARTVHDKLVARHPHVFGDGAAATASEVERSWETIKAAEKGRTGVFEGVVDAAPSLSLAAKVQQRAARVGFDWPDASGPLDKVAEELTEVRGAAGDPEAVGAEVGDLLFAVVNVARHMGVDPESSLRSAVLRFRERVEKVGELAAARGRETSSLSPGELDELWNMVKQGSGH